MVTVVKNLQQQEKRIVVISKAGKLLDNGYQVIPITSDNTPCVKGYLNDDVFFDSGIAVRWKKQFPEAGLALVCGKNDVYCLDVDIDDYSLSSKLQRVIKRKWENVAVRKCNDPRFAILFRAIGDLKDVSNASSAGYKIDGKGKLQQIELIGHKLITVYGQHRETGNTYKWTRNCTPLKNHIEDLPELDLSDVKKVFAFLEKHVPDNFKLVSNSSESRQQETEVTFDNVKPKKIYSDSQVEAILLKARGDERDDWLRVGMALHQHSNASKEGLRRWNDWSSQFQSYQGMEDCRKQWKGFRTGGGVTMQTVEYLLKKEEVNPEKLLQEYVKNLVVIKQTLEIGDLEKLANESVSPIASVKFANSHIFYPTEVTDGRTGEKKEKMIPIMDAWRVAHVRTICHDKAYLPVRQRLLQGHWKNKQELYYNIYEAPMTERTARNDLIPQFLEHINYLFSGSGDTEWMLSWMAQLVQEPQIRYRVAPLSISTFHGTGRGWLTNVLHELVGMANMTTLTKMSELVRDGAKNGFMNNSVLCVVAETHAGDKKYAVDDRLRNILGDNFQNVDVKYGAQEDKQVFTRFFFQSNHVDALVLDDVDTRIEVFINRKLPKSREYYDKLYRLLEDQSFLNQVYTYLMDYEINYSWLKASRRTPARETLIKATKSKTANAFFEFKMVVGEGMFIEQMLEEFIAEYIAMFHENDSLENFINRKEMVVLQREQLQTSSMKKLSNRTYRIKCFRQHDLTSMTDKEIKKSVARSKRNIKLFFEQHEKSATDDNV